MKQYKADIERLETWLKYQKSMCQSCRGTCCSLPVEVRGKDLVRLGVLAEFDLLEPGKQLAKRLQKMRVIEHYNQRDEIYTLARHSSGDCHYLDQKTRLCTVYERRPDTCRNHPQVGPKPGFCAYQSK